MSHLSESADNTIPGSAMSLDEQLAVWDKHIATAFAFVAEAAKNASLYPNSPLRRLARNRFIEGYVKFGQTMFDATDAWCWEQSEEEIADAPNYLIVPLSRSDGD